MYEKKPWAVGNIYPIIKGKLSFTAHRNDDHTLAEIKKNPTLFFFSSDLQERYEPYCADFGPVNLGVVHRFCTLLTERMTDPRLANRQLIYYSDEDTALRTNTAFLLGAYLVLCHKWAPEAAALPFAVIEPNPFKPFRDATYLPSDYHLTLLDCFSALHKAVQLGWYDPEGFDVEDYEYWDHPLNGDLHSHCDKFVAFKGPSARRQKLGHGVYTFTPKDYIPIFQEKGVCAVVRLNEADTYDGGEFERAGIRHYDLYFDDCTVPPRDIIRRFLDICAHEKGTIAVHCKAGLGRTGTLIALWMMKHYKLRADQCIGWLRIVRPGSVIGPQQNFLKLCEGAEWDGHRLVLAEGAESEAGASEELARQVAEGMNLRAVARADDDY
eukprot:CAMPEP_0202854842 /NCGR_PEP_ID=MMETSP1389-20130828/91209_1 /ASSEMBLY_ACC=CAM_ASM_000865 /TAXON_ID=302021 /ORGANISM="Rhodomonas sp., Strain CCMP768" /LENGTH=381 /DNA_ID=CAMNT_0049533443 /DNA_START=423 /DNA_END=1568 /DNA_ORIENTATION=-